MSFESLDWSSVFSSATLLLGGLGYTMRMAAVALLLSLVLGLVVAILRLSPVGPFRIVAYGYTQLFRALSLYVYILWIYFGVSLYLGINLDPFQSGVLCLTLLYSAYMSEVYRASIQAIDLGQWEAARSLGLSLTSTFTQVIAPQAYRIALPALVNQFVDIIKDSSIVAVIGASDLMYTTVSLSNYYRRPFEFYTATAAIYLSVVVVISLLARLLERRLQRHLA